MVSLNLPYLWIATGRRGRHYWFYRRAGQRIPITSPEGRRLKQGDAGFFEAYERIHATFGVEKTGAPAIGTLAHLINVYRAAPEFLTLAAKTRNGYGRYLDLSRKSTVIGR